MSLKIQLSETKTVVTRPAETVEISGEISINRIVDIPSEKTVFVYTDQLGRIDLPTLSNENYDTPQEWSTADVVEAVENYLNSLV
jgi:hypothetical protein